MIESKNPEDILDFWFSERVKPFWFKKDAEFDREIQNKFLATYNLAAADELNHWKNNSYAILALIILLDQFPRNMFRDSPQAFATDEQAVQLTKYALQQKCPRLPGACTQSLGVNDRDLCIEKRQFLYMPLMHSEKSADQQQSVDIFAKLGKKDYLKYAIAHQEVIDRFGRFPHRNIILGRESTATEIEFLTQPGSSF